MASPKSTADRSARNRAWPSGRWERVESAGIGDHPQLLGLGVGSADAVAAGGTLDHAAVGPAGPLAGQPLGAFGATGDGGHPPLGGEPALGIQLDHGAVAERLNFLGPA